MTNVVHPDRSVGPYPGVSLPPLILIVSSDPAARRQMEALVSAHSYLVATASAFPAARELLRSVRPDLLVSDVQLEAFNGLHLVVIGRALYPDLPAILTHPTPNPSLSMEASRLGATFLERSLGDSAFLALVGSLLAERRTAIARIRQWPRKRTEGAVTAHVSATSARVVDVSYGGLRLVFDEPPNVPEEFDVMLPDAQLTLRAQRVWTAHPAGSEEFWCGVLVTPSGVPPPTAWREFVDALQ